MRQALVNENADLCDENHRYVMRITGSDPEGQAQLVFPETGANLYQIPTRPNRLNL